MFPAPPVPPFAPDRSALTEHSMRYEDLTQDGRLMPIAIPSTMSGLWRTILVKHAGARNAQSTGVIPLLTRLTIHSRDTAVRLNKPLEVRSGFELARGLADRGLPPGGSAAEGPRGGIDRGLPPGGSAAEGPRGGLADRGLPPGGSAAEGPRGGIARLYMNVWCDLRGIAIKGGELADCGAIFAEHTFTRPFAPPDQRKITSLDVEGYPTIPEAVYAAPAPATASEPPEGATWRDELLPDGRESCFSLDQTDSNQHVNSLVYIRVFLDAAQRRLPDLRVRARAVDIAYRKPSFAGDRVRAHVRLFERAGQVGAAGFIAADDGKPRCYVRAIYGA